MQFGRKPTKTITITTKYTICELKHASPKLVALKMTLMREIRGRTIKLSLKNCDYYPFILLSLTISCSAGNKEEWSFIFCIDLRKLNSRTIKDFCYFLELKKLWIVCSMQNESEYLTLSLGIGKLKWRKMLSHIQHYLLSLYGLC